MNDEAKLDNGKTFEVHDHEGQTWLRFLYPQSCIDANYRGDALG